MEIFNYLINKSFRYYEKDNNGFSILYYVLKKKKDIRTLYIFILI